MNAHAPVAVNDPWAYWWRLGYRDLIPIIPPQANLFEGGAIAKRLAAGDDARGKAPGSRGRDGKWTGFRGWQTWETTEADLDRWRDMGASIGLRGSGEIAGIDADTLDEDLARAIKEIVERCVGRAPIRVGNYPKALYLIRTSAPFPYTLLQFGPKRENGKRDRVEILTTGKQMVVWGPHATTGRDYHWPRPPVACDELPTATPETLLAMMAEIRAAVPEAGALHQDGGAMVEVDQASLEGDPAVVEAAVRAVGNSSAQFPTRESYVQMGYRIRAALQKRPERAKELWLQWCERWNEGTNDPEIAAADWERMKPPFRSGAASLYRLADEATGGAFLAARFHEDVPPPPSWSQPATAFAGRPVPSQRWLVKDFIPARNVTLLYGDGGTGKSLASLQLAFACATGTRWLGMEVTKGRALFVTAEDENEELHRRLAAVAGGSGFTLDELDSLFVRSLAGQDAVLAAPKAATGLMEPTKRFAELKAEVMRLRPVLLVLDTLADLFGGDEIKRIQARQFIGMLQGLTVEADWDLSVLLLGHPSQSGMASGSGTSGNTAWSNSVRSRLYLSRRTVTRGEKEIEPDVDARVLTTKKSNRTRLGGEIALRWAEGRFVVAAADAARETAEGAADDGVFLSLLDKFNRSERHVSPLASSPNYAPRLFLTHADGEQVGKARLQAAMSRLFEQGVIAVEQYGYASKRYSRIVGLTSDLTSDPLPTPFRPLPS